MCRTTLSVDWDGRLYDCDFNQMLDLPLASGTRGDLRPTTDDLAGQSIVTGRHCYGCTAERVELPRGDRLVGQSSGSHAAGCSSSRAIPRRAESKRG